MSDFRKKVEALKKQQDVLAESEKKFRMDQAVYEGLLKDIAKTLGFKENEPVPFADLIKASMDMASKV